MQRQGVAAVHGVAAAALLLLLASGQAAVDQTLKPQCDIPGYVFKPNVRPAGASVTFLSAQQQLSLAAAHAACTAEPSCTMFTSDGWLIGTKVYFTAAEAAKSPDLANLVESETFGANMWSENMDLNFHTKPYCGECNDAPGCCGSTNQGNPCCGTYVAAVSAAAGQLTLQPLKPAPAIFSECEGCGSASDTERFCCLDRGSVEAVDAPCTASDDSSADESSGRTQVVASDIGYTFNVCGEFNASATSKKFCTPRCTVRVLGGTLNDHGVSARTAGHGSAVKVDDRCETHTLEKIKASGHPACCERCWQSCCSALKWHQEWVAGVKTQPRPEEFEEYGVLGDRDPSLDYPASGVCPPDASTSNPGSCCHQLSYLQSHMSLRYRGGECSLECAQKCGFESEKVPAELQSLWCFEGPMFIGWSGFHPRWVKEALVVKQQTGCAADVAAAAAFGSGAAVGLSAAQQQCLSAATEQQQCSLC